MKIDSNLLKQFINKASVSARLFSVILNFKEDGLMASIMDGVSVVRTYTIIKPEAFEEYEAVGEIIIKNTLEFMKYLDTYPGIITLEVSEMNQHILKIWDASREGYIILGSDLVCASTPENEIPDLNLSVKIPFTKELLTRTIADGKLLKNNQVTITKDKDNLIFEVGRKGESDYFKNILPLPNTTEMLGSVKVGEAFGQLYNCIDDNIVISFGENMPLMVEEVTEDITYTCIIAPMIEHSE